ncbi:hypothetical protein [Cupriavidus sp. AcVe19-6a]|uniref:hypothetical protein n=1 Tax=Cupriavidus sp. AcVe19-6a TaxID=2821358 RepID=UPI001AEB5DCF|nr:hypothetical protein [Cupriavidus sp. AcVe19-6a]MBP0635766.1 hypothetical protein [Cupriavidus sp. AcVe19-6a]
MKVLVWAAIASAAVSVSGCATSTAHYSPPTASQVSASKTVATPFDATWDKLVKNLASDFFVINNIDKNSRLINVSFSSDRPSDYVDCGFSSRTFKNARGESSYNYRTADSAQFTFANKDGMAFNVNRKTRLEGRINVYVAPEASGTVVNANVKYILGVNIVSAPLGGGVPATANIQADFSTKAPYVGSDFTCHANGAIESRVLGFVER